MSKFLTPPVWYNKMGNLVEILTGDISFESGTALGKGSLSGSYSVAIGTNAQTYDNNEIAIGYGSESSIQGSIVIGANSTLSHRDHSTHASIVIGNASEIIGEGNISIGEKIKMGADDFDSKENIAIGSNSAVYGSGCIAIGGGIQLGAATLEGLVSNIIQIGATDETYTFKVGDRDVFSAIDAATNTATAAAGTFFIGTTKYKATYDSSSATLNFVPVTT